MPGMQFEFDETGGSFYYFLVSFYLLVLIPVTYFFWPKTDNKDLLEQNRRKCRCEPCQTKQHFLNSSTPNKHRKKKFIQGIFIFAWIVFFLLAYKVSQIEMEWTEFDPFAELGVSKEASASEIRKAYKQLSLKFHPDKGGDPKRFIRLSKAYAALTNEQSRNNWQEYGNPDGPGATQFGIALPKWIVDKKNSVWVLGVYVLVFMVVLPVSVGLWWYRTIKFNSDKILLNTTQLYFYFFNRTQNMPLKRVIMILSSSLEFNKVNNSEIVERPSDNEEVPAVLKHFPQINIKSKEMPFAAVYSVKSRVLIYSHLHRYTLPMHSLNLDKIVIIKKCPFLINEMINIVAQLVAIGHHDVAIHVPRLETIEHCMKLSQLIVQGLSENQSPMMQLPHVTEDILRHFVTRKRNVRSIRQLVEMKEEDRRNLLRSFTDEQYRDLIQVCSNMPLVIVECHCEVMDEDDPTITPSSIVTVTVKLTRKPLGTLFPQGMGLVNSKWTDQSVLWPVDNNQSDGTLYSSMPAPSDVVYSSDSIITNNTNPSVIDEDAITTGDKSDQESKIDGSQEPGVIAESSNTPKKKPAVWEKSRKKKGGNPIKSGKNKPKKPKLVPVVAKQNGRILSSAQSTDEKNEQKLPLATVSRSLSQNEEDENNSEDTESVVGGGPGDNDDYTENNEDSAGGGPEPKEKFDDDDKWKRFQEEARRENSLETKDRTTHQVHCPYLPVEKFEWWWVYLADKKTHGLITAPLQVCSLQDREDLQLKFTAPSVPGQYIYSVCLRSDSYLDFDQFEQIKITVKEAKKVDYDTQWKISEDEENSYASDASDLDESVDKPSKSHRNKSVVKKQSSDEDEDLSSNTDYDYDD